jgi:hypothetical protein
MRGKMQGSFAAKMGTCMECDFFKVIQKEEGTKMVGIKKGFRETELIHFFYLSHRPRT